MKRILFISLACFSCKKISINESVKAIQKTNIVQDSTLPIIILAGQSNMEGASVTIPFPDSFKKEMPNALIFYKPTNTSINNGSVQNLKYGVNQNWENVSSRVGSELGIGKYVTNAGKKIGIIKYAYQGSRLVDIGYVNTGNWQVDATSNCPRHYKILVNNFVKPGLDSLRAKGYNPYIVALAWCQGEKDSQDSTCASRYECELRRLDSAFRVDVPEAANMEFIVTRTRLNTWPYAPVVRQAQINVADYWIDSDSWQLNTDGVHYTRTEQCIKHGKAISDILIPLIP